MATFVYKNNSMIRCGLYRNATNLLRKFSKESQQNIRKYIVLYIGKYFVINGQEMIF